MTIAEIDAKLKEIFAEKNDLILFEQKLCAELGRKALPLLEDNPDFVADIAAIREATATLTAIDEKIAALSLEKSNLQAALTCFVCKTVNHDGSAFCEECGAKLGEKPREYCEACKIMNSPNQKFCGECGARLVDGQAADTATV